MESTHPVSRITVPPTSSVALPGRPGKVRCVVVNESASVVRIVKSEFEIKWTLVGAAHALPRDGWGYATTTAIAPGTGMPGESELWFTLDAHERTTFGGAIPAQAAPVDEPQCYFAGRILYLTDCDQLRETAFYRRLCYADMTFSVIDPGDADLNYDGRRLCGADG